MGKKSISLKPTGNSNRATFYNWHRGPRERNFAVVTKSDVKDINKKYYEPKGKYFRTKFTIGFELEKVDLPRLQEYAIFKGYEEDGSLSGRNVGEAITNILPLVPKGALRNKIFNLMFQAAPIINSNTNTSCGGHTTICVTGMDSQELLRKVREYSGLVYALYRGRLNNSFCDGDMRMRGGSQSRYSVALAKDGGCVEFRLPSAIPSVMSLIRRYEIFYLMLDFAINKDTINFSAFLNKCKPIVLRMYDYNQDRADMILGLAKDFQHYINTGNRRQSVRQFIG